MSIKVTEYYKMASVRRKQYKAGSQQVAGALLTSIITLPRPCEQCLDFRDITRHAPILQ